ncbi:MAG: TPR end-of-group domain-containing protein [Phycisphaerales bacterium JB039]
MTPRVAIAAAAGLLAAIVTLLSAGPSQAADAIAGEARIAFNRGDWPAAIDGYRLIVEREPDNARAWFRLGFALHADGRIAEALEAHLKAAEFPEGRGTALYNAACACALLGHHDAALATLDEAVTAGFRNLRHLRDDPDFAPYHDDERYQAVVDRIEALGVEIQLNN